VRVNAGVPESVIVTEIANVPLAVGMPLIWPSGRQGSGVGERIRERAARAGQDLQWVIRPHDSGRDSQPGDEKGLWSDDNRERGAGHSAGAVGHLSRKGERTRFVWRSGDRAVGAQRQPAGKCAGRKSPFKRSGTSCGYKRL
jgi:hypothetical protein